MNDEIVEYHFHKVIEQIKTQQEEMVCTIHNTQQRMFISNNGDEYRWSNVRSSRVHCDLPLPILRRTALDVRRDSF